MATTISRDELKAKIDSHEDFQLVEALAQDEFQQQHLPGAINLPPDRVKDRASQVLPDKDADIVVYCGSSTCAASENAAAELERQGYSRVRRYVEGKKDWAEAGLPMEGQKHAVGA
jgi:rhodanese-related sulfurtransferase